MSYTIGVKPKNYRDREDDREGYSSLIAAAFFEAVGQRIGPPPPAQQGRSTQPSPNA